MKRLISAGVVALATVAMMGAANTADIARRQAVPRHRLHAPYNWIGFASVSAAAAAGAIPIGMQRSAAAVTTSGARRRHRGYNCRRPSGVWHRRRYRWTNIRGSSSAVPCTTSCDGNPGSHARGRIGYVRPFHAPYHGWCCVRRCGPTLQAMRQQRHKRRLDR